MKYDEENYRSLYRSWYPDRMHTSGCPDPGMQFNIDEIPAASRHSRHSRHNIACNGSSFDNGRNVPAGFNLV
jgi:hypothetical protein